MLDKPIWENIVRSGDGDVPRRAVPAVGVAQGTRRRPHRPARHQDAIGELRAGQLSGGNQQKVVLAKWLDTKPTTLVLDDPTRGVDIGARVEIHGLLRTVADQGGVVLLRSTDLEELASACDRVVVLYRGRVCAELRGPERSARTILHLMNTGEPLGSSPTATGRTLPAGGTAGVG